ncbi:MAG: anthranilate synthase component I family protein [Muribaculaceae bacterium]|nr:anthranilate synthase component I family protein [Muribaculaceae bacterium]
MKTKLRVISREIPADMVTPVGIYLKIRDLYPKSALLESSDYQAAHNSLSYIGVDPIGEFRVALGKITEKRPDGSVDVTVIDSETNVVECLRRYVESFEVEGSKSDDVNGLFGFTAYDAVRYFEKVEISPREKEFENIPDICYILYRYVIRLNHYKSSMTVFEHLGEDETDSIDEIVSVMSNNNVAFYPFRVQGEAKSPITDEQYMAMVERGIAHARRGDVFQIVLSRRFSQSFHGDDFNVYRALRSVNPSPYLFFFDFGDFKVFGSSPETHLRVEGDTAYIDPIAGTFRRTGDDARDRELAKALLSDEKENAEHIMLVDLARNDLSRGGGKVEIEFLKQVQYYSHVIHMVSRVKASLPESADRFRLFADTFPAGTLSGAPKVRAMQLINEIEPHSRVVYGGCIGFIGFTGNLNQAITIRSFLSYKNTLYSQAGAGIVARSVPRNELQETNNKLGALVSAVKFAEQFDKQ